MALLAAITRDDIADYVQALFEVYIAMIFIYLLATMAFSFGLRPPYSRGVDVVMNFLREVCEPYLRVFRRFMPQLGMIDLSPLLALIVLFILEQIIPNLIAG